MRIKEGKAAPTAMPIATLLKITNTPSHFLTDLNLKLAFSYFNLLATSPILTLMFEIFKE